MDMAKDKGGKGQGKQGKSVKARSAVEQARYDVSLPQELLDRARRDAERERYMTPYRVAQKYNVTISTARKILYALEEEGVLVRFTRNRRSPIFIHKSKLVEAPRGL